MKHFLRIGIFLTVFYFGLNYFNPEVNVAPVSLQNDDSLAIAFRDHRSNFQVTGKGNVTRILPDDQDGSRHQRFILTLASGQTLLIAHNIDLASRISSLRNGDLVEFNGEYEWNAQGGVIHWTHDDPNGRHRGVWLKHNGRTYH